MNNRIKTITSLLISGVCMLAGWLNAATSVSNTTTHAVHATLAEALAAVNADGQTLALTSGVFEEPELTINYAVTLQGAGTLDTIVQPAGDTRIASVSIPVEYGVTLPVVFLNLTLSNGVTDGSGGAIFVGEGRVIVSNCVVSGNSAANGGGLYCMPGADASLTVDHSIISGNTASQQGGGAMRGLYRNCTFFGNSADKGGAAAYAVLEDCVFEENHALEQGGGLLHGRATLPVQRQRCFGGGAPPSGQHTADAEHRQPERRCTLRRHGGRLHTVGNTAGRQGGGVCGASVTNSICTTTMRRLGKTTTRPQRSLELRRTARARPRQHRRLSAFPGSERVRLFVTLPLALHERRIDSRRANRSGPEWQRTRSGRGGRHGRV